MAGRSVDSDWETVSTGSGRADDWETVSGPKVSVSFSPSTATDDELRQAAIGGNRDAIKEFHSRNVSAGEEIDPTTLGSALQKAGAGVLQGVASIPGGIYGMAKQAVDPALAVGRSASRLVSGQSTIGQELGNIPSYIKQHGAEVAESLKSPVSRDLPNFVYGTPREAGQIAGQYAGMAALPKAAGIVAKVVPPIAEVATSRLINSLIKTQPKEFRFGRNPGLEVARQNLNAASRESLLEKIQTRTDQLNKKVESGLKQPFNASKSVDITPAVNVIDTAIQDAVGRGEQALYDRLNTLKDQVTRGFEVDEQGKLTPVGEPRTTLSPLDTNKLKIRIGKETAWTGQAFDKDLNKVRVAVYGTLNDLVDNASPGTKYTNAQVANLIGAAKSLEREINLGESRNITGHLFSKGMSGMVGAALGSSAGLPWEGGALAGMAAEKALGSPLSKTIIASRLAKIAGKRPAVSSKVYPIGKRDLTE